MENTSDIVVGIDLGTTNSVVAVYENKKMNILEVDHGPLLPSYVGISPENQLLVGHAARNQFILYPEKTIKSIKRRMGGTESIQFGDRSLLPEEISALLLTHLKTKAEEILGQRVSKAVITVPAYFNDTQRQATRAAGEIAGLEVVRILNEPTAASLAFQNSVLKSSSKPNTISVVYDLGGGTFDVSIVQEGSDVTEVLASHGDTQLGGDDFDQLILDRLINHIQKNHKVDLRQNKHAMNRLAHTAEAAKIELSNHPYTRILEEDLTGGKNAIHLDMELTREEYEEMIENHINKTIDCVEQALKDANLTPSQIDNVLLVGGSTRTPLVHKVLTEYFHREPHSELHPDLCVVMGAAILAARASGKEVDQVLIDITPYTFGVSALVFDVNGMPNPNRFVPIIPRNTPLPVSRSDEFETIQDYQKAVEVNIYQGEHEDVRYNLKIGTFLIEGLSEVPAGNIIVDRMSLDLNGILTVTAIEKRTGLQKSIKIEGAYKPKNKEDIQESKNRIADIIPFSEITESAQNTPAGSSSLPPDVDQLISRAQSAFDKMHKDDREEAQIYIEQIKQKCKNGENYSDTLDELQDLLYFIGE